MTSLLSVTSLRLFFLTLSKKAMGGNQWQPAAGSFHVIFSFNVFVHLGVGPNHCGSGQPKVGEKSAGPLRIAQQERAGSAAPSSKVLMLMIFRISP